MTEHTPAPWSVQVVRNGEYCYVMAADGRQVVAQVILPFSDKPYDELAPERLANANLLAAAPDLLKALEDIVTYCECAPTGGDPRLLYELFHTAKAAIAKATEASHA